MQEIIRQIRSCVKFCHYYKYGSAYISYEGVIFIIDLISMLWGDLLKLMSILKIKFFVLWILLQKEGLLFQLLPPSFI